MRSGKGGSKISAPAEVAVFLVKFLGIPAIFLGVVALLQGIASLDTGPSVLIAFVVSSVYFVAVRKTMLGRQSD